MLVSQEIHLQWQRWNKKKSNNKHNETSEYDWAVQTVLSLFELRTSILVQEKKDEMQCLYCSVVFVDFKLHYNNTDMLRWSCRWRRCQWCVWLCIKVCVCFQLGGISDVPYIPLLRDYRPTFCVASFFFPSSSSSLFILATITWLIDRHTSPITSALLNWHSAQVVVCQKHGGNERKTRKSCMRSVDRSALMRGEGSALSSSVR